MAQPDETAIPHTVTLVDGQRAVWIAGPTCVRHELVAEIHFPEQMERLIAWVRGRTDAVVTGWLMPEQQSGFDPHAVATWVLGGKVGYLSREASARWQSILLPRVDPRGAEADDQRRQGCSLRMARGRLRGRRSARLRPAGET